MGNITLRRITVNQGLKYEGYFYIQMDFKDENGNDVTVYLSTRGWVKNIFDNVALYKDVEKARQLYNEVIKTTREINERRVNGQ